MANTEYARGPWATCHTTSGSRELGHLRLQLPSPDGLQAVSNALRELGYKRIAEEILPSCFINMILPAGHGAVNLVRSGPIDSVETCRQTEVNSPPLQAPLGQIRQLSASLDRSLRFHASRFADAPKENARFVC